MQVRATPLLYQNMEIDVGRLDEDLFATLMEGHPDLPQVRTLRISTQNKNAKQYAVSAGMTALQAKIVCRLLNATPRNSLMRFEYVNMYHWKKRMEEA